MLCLRPQVLSDTPGKRLHKNHWHIGGMLRVGFKNVGKVAPNRRGISDTSHGLLTLTTCAHIANQSQHDSFEHLLKSGLRAGAQGIVVNRYHDATPLMLKFGYLQDKVYKHAKYLVPDPGSRTKYKAVAYDEYIKTTGATRTPRAGCLELFAQTIDVHWQQPATANSPLHHIDVDLLMSPVIIQNTAASTIYRAVEDIFDALNLDAIQDLATSVRVFLIHEVPDNVSANLRRKHAYAEKLPANCLYSSRLNCCVHTVHNILDYALGSKKLVGDVYAVSFVLAQPKHRDKMLVAAKSLVVWIHERN